jgi:predicted transcriptional regulator
MPQEEFETLLQFFKAVADETRLKLLGILATREHSVEELAALLQLKAPTISHHLAKLKELNLVGMRSEGNIHIYWLNAEALRDSSKGLLSSEKMASLVDDVEGDAYERKVLKDFFEGKKRSVILKWLANQFDPGVHYSEVQVNEILQRYHPDSATLCREMIGEHLLQREKSFYWRIP